MATSASIKVERPGDRKGLRAADGSPAGRARLACVILKHLKANYHNAQHYRAMLVRVNDDTEFRRLFDNTYEAHGLNAVYRAILDSLIIVLSRMYDPINPKNIKGLDRASLPHIFHLLENVDTQNQFLAAAWYWTPGMLEVKQLSTCKEHLERARNAHSQLKSSTLGSSVFAGLKWYRDANLAHSLFRNVKRRRLVYGEIGDLLDQTAPIILDLSLALMGEAWADDGSREAIRKADAFWSVVGEGMRAK